MAYETEKPLKPKNVYIVGAHCTGKTTLIDALKEHFTPALCTEIFGTKTMHPYFLDEVVRLIMELEKRTADQVRDPIEGFKLQAHTLGTQFQFETVFNELWLLSDRSGIDPIVYAHFFLGSEASDRLVAMEEWDILRTKMKDGLVILCEPTNACWLSTDPVRVALHDLEEWRALGNAFKDWLDAQGIRYVPIPADLEKLEWRVQFVEGLIRSGI
ncbi:hypothetical protein P170DRAFT_476353 [Aspergillus steynii IBT 23096]|uniref:NadR/Ttd14 AAA domain-containing protein n=1 Tax=Aspergillus steynii IBT 23096 TaxID=1392250 RepID=A0A2I2G460_9EURO|nr:uncharacterized protein P170DRAFT_476353 [Aspergillus steynii IBT 23096]PLB47670.1 hypothetical protein P170DRAFT_476353 [Aspergillus steynii IBT 23096]